MSEYLLDTNVVSELARAHPHPSAAAWLRSAGEECFLSVLTVGELRRGVWMLQQHDARKAARIGAWVDEIASEYADRILPVDGEVAQRWATLPARRTLPVIDALIAATALAHGLVVATRNTKDFADTGVLVVDPFG